MSNNNLIAKKILVTSALPYANGPIHLGHLVEYIQTDIFVRYLKLTGHDTIYCCADDAHGTPIEINARRQGISPEELIAKYYNEHLQDFIDFQILFNSYYTTNSPENKDLSDLIFSRLRDNGDIYQKEILLTYCEQCKRFLPDRYVKGICPKCGAEDQYGDNCEICNATYETTTLKKPYCSICGNPPTQKMSNHYFFRLSAYSERLKNWLEKNNRLQPEIKNYIFHWINSGLNDWDISRDVPYFGFPILGETDKYYYVWLDAPIGYMASSQHYCQNHGLDFKEYWEKESGQVIHFIGKDIIYFHFLFWPAMLMGSGFNPPYDIVVHGFLNINKMKMSKSRGTFITARDYLEKLDPSYLRFYYAYNLSRNMTDLDLDMEDFKNRINSDLIGNFANLTYRSMSFLKQHFEGMIISFRQNELSQQIAEKIENIKNYYKNCELRSALKQIMEISDIGNKFFQKSEPWKVMKEDKNKAQQDISFCLDIVKKLCILLKPILPRTCNDLERQLNLSDLTFADLDKEITGVVINKPFQLLKKIDELELVQKDPLSRVDLRVAEIEKVEEHPQADKLYVLQIDVGKEKRQIIAGIRPFFTKEELVGKKIIIVYNLKPAELRGQKSQGMLLAASDENNMGLLTTNQPSGSEVRIIGIDFDGTREINIKDFQLVSLSAREGKVYYKGNPLKYKEVEVFLNRAVEGMIK
ncbi:MAG: methionine--tRNA ligase [bacterium]